jgi:hypothetical protein
VIDADFDLVRADFEALNETLRAARRRQVGMIIQYVTSGPQVVIVTPRHTVTYGTLADARLALHAMRMIARL